MAPKKVSKSSSNESGMATFGVSETVCRPFLAPRSPSAGDRTYQRDVSSVRVEDLSRMMVVDSKQELGPPTFQLLDTSRLDTTNYPFKFNTILNRKDLVGLQYTLAREMEKVIIRMQEHENADNLLRRQPESLTRVICGESIP
ncbi:hypothetical protein GSI_08776 [Ganoderma sinense ZZ0214-1]|uniref:Uncharacterized protein n=1 Tax=Ganoderma sinense ZZ0214-1 TaxID=1077348 RepID=A0A2G8S4N9_9APHY|nr:hypothetical protein GSI_08776 [Ganoderma sinense ZZ0214-1]